MDSMNNAWMDEQKFLKLMSEFGWLGMDLQTAKERAAQMCAEDYANTPLAARLLVEMQRREMLAV